MDNGGGLSEEMRAKLLNMIAIDAMASKVLKWLIALAAADKSDPSYYVRYFADKYAEHLKELVKGANPNGGDADSGTGAEG